jgi:hypothetical protein
MAETRGYSTMVAVGGDVGLPARQQELERQSFAILDQEGGTTVLAVKGMWHWDCIMTKLSYFVFIKKVKSLTGAAVLEELQQLRAVYDPSMQPKGCQKGRANILVFLVEGEADEEAHAIAAAQPAKEFATFNMIGIVEASGRESYFTGSPCIGKVYWGKLRWMVERLLRPSAPVTSPPVSGLGAAITLTLLFFLVASLASLFAVIYFYTRS